MGTTWNPSDKDSLAVLTNGNLTANYSGAFVHFAGVRATTSKSTGKWYFEIVATNVTNSSANTVYGLGNSSFSLTAAVNSSITAWYYNSGVSVRNGTTVGTSPSTTISTGDVVMFAVDFDAGKIWLGKNGTWFSSGVPSTGTLPWTTFTANTALFPALDLSLAGDTCTLVTSSTTYSASGFSVWDTVPGALASTGSAAVAFTGLNISPATLTSAGSASNSSSGAGVAVAALVSVGTGSVSLNGATVLSGTLSASGVATASFSGFPVLFGAMTSAGVSVALFDYPDRQITSNNIVPLPIDYYLAGQPHDFRKGHAPGYALRGIFKE